MSEHSGDYDAPQIERRDRYTILVDGHPIRATEAQERQLRAMDAAGVRRFLTIMGCLTPPAEQADR